MSRFTLWIKGALDTNELPRAENAENRIEMGLLPNEQKELEALHMKSDKLTQRGTSALVVAVLLGAVAALTSFVASQIGLPTDLPYFVIPPQLSSALSDGGSQVDSFSSGLSELSSFTIESFIPTLSILGVLVGGFLAVVRGSILPVIPAVALAFATQFLTLLPDLDPSASGNEGGDKSERTLFAEYAEDMNVAMVQKVLQRNDGLPEPFVSYVTAQADLAEGKSRTPAMTKTAALLRNDYAALATSPKISYLIERGADGRVESKAAKAYLETASSRQAAIRTATFGFTAAAVLTSITGLVLCLLGLQFRSRFSRIMSILLSGAHSETDTKAAG